MVQAESSFRLNQQNKIANFHLCSLKKVHFLTKCFVCFGVMKFPCLRGGRVLAAPVRPFGYAPLSRRSSRKPPIARVATRSPLQLRTVARRIRLCAPERGNALAAHMIF